MRRKTFAPLVVALTLVPFAARTQESQPRVDEGVAVRGAFATTRPGAGAREAKQDAATRKGATEKDGPARAVAGVATGTAETAGARAKPRAAAAMKTSADAGRPAGIAVGYTLFMREGTGAAVRVSSRREFKSGDAVRLLLEANTDGYLYIFSAENDGRPLMIFPNAKLDAGANFIRAHVPNEIPSSREADENLRWFVFDERPATEHVYVVVTRRPVEGVPAGEALVKWCAESGAENACAWSPAPELWASLQGAGGRGQVATSRAADDGRAETAAEHDAATRGLGLAADAPLPSVIHMITSASADILVATLDLIHR